jgi:hypothetical protein
MNTDKNFYHAYAFKAENGDTLTTYSQEEMTFRGEQPIETWGEWFSILEVEAMLECKLLDGFPESFWMAE